MEDRSLAKEILNAMENGQADDSVIRSRFMSMINSEYDNRSIIVEPYDVVDAAAESCVVIMRRIGAIDDESIMGAATKFFYEIAMTMTKILFSEEE